MKKVREGRIMPTDGTKREQDALNRMENDLVSYWLWNHEAQWAKLGLAQKQNESVEAWVARAKPIYRSQSDFWQQLMIHALFAHY
jgi:hypothetical protein